MEPYNNLDVNYITENKLVWKTAKPSLKDTNKKKKQKQENNTLVEK